MLIEKEWLSFGHKFGDRVGHGVGSDENNERCPVFLQWIDCVHQIHRQFPCSFEFSMGYLVSSESPDLVEIIKLNTFFDKLFCKHFR